MNEIVDMRNVGNICRLCLSSREPKSSVFADNALATISLAAKIQTCLSIEILTSDKLSTLICYECLRRINKWHAYKEYCLRSQKKLQQCLGERSDGVENIKLEPTDYNEPTSPLETVPLSSDDDDNDNNDNDNDEAEITIEKRGETTNREIIHANDYDETSGITRPAVSAVKRETEENMDNQDIVIVETPEMETFGSTELLLNPMAVAGHKDERLMEADSTQKSTKIVVPSRRGIKKKQRRGPQTHYRGLRRYKQRCSYCQIYLHSKHSYANHMERFHSGKIHVRKTREMKQSSAENGKMMVVVEEENDDEYDDDDDDDYYEDDEEDENDDAMGKFGNKSRDKSLENDIHDTEMIEDVEDELASLEKDAPLTPVQQNIISQLKTFSCYTCRLCFADRRSTLNHIRQHMPDLRPYTCIACLTEFADRSIYKLHCGASFQCAMKIALVIPEHGMEKYFTCNMCLRSLANRKELLSHLSRHSDKQYEQMISQPFRSPPKLKPIVKIALDSSSSNLLSYRNNDIRRNNDKSRIKVIASVKKREYNEIPAPYKNGDSAHNHKCIYCGMIYRYKQNLSKHLILCKKLMPSSRICYRCVNCGMTFLAFNKFQNHVSNEHRKKDLVCHRCGIKFKSSDFLSHYREHYIDNIGNFAVSTRSIDSKRSSKVERWKSDITTTTTTTTTIVQDDEEIAGRYSCALCRPKSYYPTKTHLAEHRKVHHPNNTTTYSCTICRCNFGKVSILEAHMTDKHGISDKSRGRRTNPNVRAYDNEELTTIEKKRFSIKSDPGVNSTECNTCGKVFANYPNLRRHIRTVHDTVGRFSCFTCAKTFVREQQWTEHVEKEHRRAAERVENCPQCPEIFESQQELILHRRNVHGANGEDHLACYICGKSFANETSLKIHRGHHFRVNSRLSIGNNRESVENNEITEINEVIEEEEMDRKPIISQKQQQQQPLKSPRARKSFPNASPARQMSSAFLQCQVCDDLFNDVSDLRKHLWEVHCARNKPEKQFVTEKYQCELCTNILPDEESLESHIKWHESNPILGNDEKIEIPAQCDLCGKFYSSIGNLRKHKKRHKTCSLVLNKLQSSSMRKKSSSGDGFACNICRKIFAMRSTMIKHKAVAHPSSNRQQQQQQQHEHEHEQQQQQQNSSFVGGTSSNSIVKPEIIIRPVRPKLDFDTLANRETSSDIDKKKSLVCSLCRKIVPDVRALYKHRQNVHKITNDTIGMNINFYDSTDIAQVSCTVCTKLFSNVANMRQHFTKVHGAGARTSQQQKQQQQQQQNQQQNYRCSVDGCKLAFKNLVARQNHEKSHANVMYTCALCPRHMLNPGAMAEHMLTAHKTNYQQGNNKMALCKKIDLDNYVVKGACGRQCPICKITYPNNKALKVHYLKIHEGAD